MTTTSASYLPGNRPPPVPMEAGMDQPHFDGLRDGKLVIQRCGKCETWVWGPEHLCYNCLAWDPDWVEVAAEGIVFSWTRVFTPGSPVLRTVTPYLAVLVELPHAGGVRMIGNLLGDPAQAVKAGDKVVGVFERHEGVDEPYGLLQWRKIG